MQRCASSVLPCSMQHILQFASFDRPIWLKQFRNYLRNELWVVQGMFLMMWASNICDIIKDHDCDWTVKKLWAVGFIFNPILFDRLKDIHILRPCSFYIFALYQQASHKAFQKHPKTLWLFAILRHKCFQSLSTLWYSTNKISTGYPHTSIILYKNVPASWKILPFRSWK